MTTDFSRSSMRRNRSGRGCDAGEPRLLDRHEIWNMRYQFCVRAFEIEREWQGSEISLQRCSELTPELWQLCHTDTIL